MTESALARLRTRLQAFNSDGDMTAIVGDDTLRDISALGLGRGLQHADMAAMKIVAWLYWYRSQAPGGAQLGEREKASKLFELIYISDPEAVPGALQPVLRERRQAKQEHFAAASPFARPTVDVQQLIRQSAEQFQRYHATNDQATLDSSISGFRQVLAVLPPGNVMRPLCEVMLGTALQFLWERSSSPEVLGEAVTQLRDGLAGLPGSHEMRPMALAALAALLHAQYLQREDPVLLKEAGQLIEEAAATVPLGSPMYQQIQSARNMMTVMHPANLVDPCGMDQAIAAARAKLDGTPPGHPDRPQRVMELGMALAARFAVTRILEDPPETLRLLREAADAAEPGSMQQAALRGMMGAVLSEIGTRDGDPAQTAESVGLLREALAAARPDDPQSAAFHGNLAVAIWHQYVTTEEPGLLTEAIKESRKALEMVPGDSPIRNPVLHNLACALHDLYRRTGDSAALDEAISLGRQGERTVPRGGPARGPVLSTLAVSLILAHQRSNDPQQAEEAVTWAREAAGTVPAGHPDQLGYTVTLAQALEARSAGGHPADLEEAIDQLRQAAHALVARQHSTADLQYIANTLSIALLSRADGFPDLATVEEALGWLRRATADETPGPGRDRCLAMLGKALQHRHRLTLDRGALADALAAFGGIDPASQSPARQVLRHIERGRTAAVLFDWPVALESFAAAVEALPQLAGRDLRRGDQEYGLAMVSGLAGDSAAAALIARQPQRAAELLEQGRGVLLSQALDMRGDVDELAGDDPERARLLAAIRDRLDALNRAGPNPAQARDDPQEAGRRAQLRHQLSAQWAGLVAEIRSQGRDRFLRPPGFADLTGPGSVEPVALLNVSRYRSDAILLTSGGLEQVPLAKDGVLLAAVQQHVSEFAEAISRLTKRVTEEQETQQDSERREAARCFVTRTLGWLWDDIAAPVLDRLDLLGEPADAAAGLSRIWWCAGGPLSLLPLHAAGRDGTAVLDYVVSSYTPTVRALRRAQQRPPELDPAAGMLAVAMQQTRGADDLMHASSEMTWLKQAFGAETLRNDEATRDRILAALPRHPIAHFACHCRADLTTPSASGLLCHDHQQHPLTVADLSRLDLADARLAYLSACSTSQTRADLADEALHITAAFQIAGYAQVIGSLWPVDDGTSKTVARRVYETLRRDGPAGRSAAYALHDAVRAVRSGASHVEQWAPYIHAGA